MRRFKSSSSKDQRVPTPDFTENTVSNGLEWESGLNPMKFMGIFVVCLMGLSVLFSLSAILQNPPSESLWTVAEARPLDVLPQKVSICRRLTRPKDYQAKTEQGLEANKGRICIDVLEREMHRNPMAGDLLISSLTMVDVAFARMFFPTKAKLAMEIAQAETASELSGLLSSKGSSGNLREVDLNETPNMQNKRFMEDYLPDLFYLEKGTPEEQRIKRTRFIELRDKFKGHSTRTNPSFIAPDYLRLLLNTV
ncbi:Hypothetical predicted protein [Olea europaea subsp. europaea]|uniref:NPR1/NIM1-like C-terminal domain-containing protein n=1 Tax=Olea europaea subsp. europaea TaxID=158383 RepID=A0A8S0S8P0_OLEEU|nr:Hypothetical predicted protein [Olea europaea subsp. europaea]